MITDGSKIKMDIGSDVSDRALNTGQNDSQKISTKLYGFPKERFWICVLVSFFTWSSDGKNRKKKT